MWGAVLLAAVVAAFDPIRLAVVYLVISRPDPIRNLIAYMAGCVVACSYMLVLPLILLNEADIARFDGSSMGRVRIWLGVGALMLAAVLMLVRFRAPRPRFGSVLQTVRKRARKLWDRGGWWTSAAVGVAQGGPPWDALALLFAMIAITDATVTMQIASAATLVVVMLAVVEAILIAHLINREKAQVALEKVCEWVTGHRREFLAAISALAGLFLLAGVPMTTGSQNAMLKGPMHSMQG